MFIERDANGKITALYSNRQIGIAEEELPDDDPRCKIALPVEVALKETREVREKVLNRLTGIQINATDQNSIIAIQTARTDLLNITACTGMASATDYDSTKATIMAEWKRIALALATAAPSAASAFSGLDM